MTKIVSDFYPHRPSNFRISNKCVPSPRIFVESANAPPPIANANSTAEVRRNVERDRPPEGGSFLFLFLRTTIVLGPKTMMVRCVRGTARNYELCKRHSPKLWWSS